MTQTHVLKAFKLTDAFLDKTEPTKKHYLKLETNV